MHLIAGLDQRSVGAVGGQARQLRVVTGAPALS